MKITSVGERIRARRKELRLTQKDLSAKVGVSHVSISQWEKDETAPRGENLLALANALGVSANFLSTGEESASNVSPSDMGTKRIPVLSYVQAGMWTESQEITGYDGSTSYLLMDDDCSKSAFALVIEGESMLPKFTPGDRIIVDPEVFPVPGDFVVARDELKNETVFKKYRPTGSDQHGNDIYELVPLNDDFPTLRSESGRLNVIGTMIEHRISRKNHRR
ncbi:helix-turn-helix domain-containing protein [Erwinia pyri]|uniref:Helix-turn-helix domain-containing protein n=1 Tax=Erwinia pyri TaxID=3062598 RepID=A0AA50DFH2_9GAMM|nr:helix-turn-helix domain-containing protein [Erwinia sp. DE2]WLS77384.1 helix-turn-helix domain-containing protein [Erwinia sp. DE2]